MRKGKEHTERLNRRSFFKRSWGWLGILAGIEVSALSINFLMPGRKKNNADKSLAIKTVGDVKQITPGSVIPFKNGQFYLVRLEDGGIMALSLTCTHLGCSITYSSAKQEFICPCHASSFDINGNVLNPPAPRALDTYRVFIEHGLIKVDTGRLIRRKKFSKSDLIYV